MKVQEIQALNKLHVLKIGRSGSGKTKTGLDFIKGIGGKNYAFILDNRVGLFREFAKKNPQFELEIDIFQSSYNTLASRVDQLVDIAKKSPDKFPYKNILFCGITSLIDLLVLDSLRLQGASEGVQDKTKGHWIGNKKIPDMSHYLFVSEAVRSLFYDGLFHFPCNLFVEAHVVNDYDSQGNVSGRKVLATDKIAEKLPGYFDETWEYICEDSTIPGRPPNYKVRFRSSIAKTAIPKGDGNLPNEIDVTDKDFFEEFKKYVKMF